MTVQPPSGGCVLKHFFLIFFCFYSVQPPSGGCVLKPDFKFVNNRDMPQPPSGGCVLKQLGVRKLLTCKGAAAFGRLCVETMIKDSNVHWTLQAAAFGRLCVETKS